MFAQSESQPKASSYHHMTRRPHGKNLRKGRYSQPGGTYLPTWNTEQRAP